MSSYYRVVAGGACYGCTNTEAQARAIIKMRTSGSGDKGKSSASSNLNYNIETVSGEYPPRDWKMWDLGYKPGR
jgi:hypothetical protein